MVCEYFVCYCELEDIIVMFGFEVLFEGDCLMVLWVCLLQCYLIQLFFVVVEYIGIVGVLVLLEMILVDCEVFIVGQYDDLFEECCYMCGSMEGV